ncbi:MAG: hypothetical protein AAFZ65_14440, partial [Planctomycetota bacterium]
MHRPADQDPQHTAPRAPEPPYQASDDLRSATRRRFMSGAFEASRVVRAAGHEGESGEAFRARLRRDFASGDIERRAGSRQVLRQALGAEPTPSFRSQLSARFVLGQLEAAPAAQEPDRQPALEERPAAPIHDLAAARRRLVPGIVAGLLAAAALLLTTLPTLLGPEWHPRTAARGVVFDQNPIEAGKPLPVRTDRVLACGPEALRLSLSDRALVQASPSSQIRFCEPVWTLFGTVRAPVHLDAGTLDVQTLQGEEDL